jgi:hypothetical protein
MAIIETKIISRPNASIPFFSQTDNATLLAAKTTMGSFNWVTNTETYQKGVNASGSHIVERNYSSDLLTQTTKMTFDSLSTWSTVDSALSIALDKEYSAYVEDNELINPASDSEVAQYTLTGIDAPFTCTTTYTYNSNTLTGYTLFESFIEVIEASDKLTGFTNTGTQLVAVHTYTNAADFTENHWRDFNFVTSLHNGGVTRTISYALVSNDA